MSNFEELGGTYRNENGYLIPNLSVPETKPIGKYGRMRKRYLQEQHPIIFSELLLSGQLYPHLLEIDHACHGRMELLTCQMAEREGVTEALKTADQMERVRHMNSIQARAEEIILNELIYIEEAPDADT